MLMTRRSRGRLRAIDCHDECDGNMSPGNVKRHRRMVKRRERREWQRGL